MKQRLTKMCALVLVLVMFLSMAMPALAADSSDPNLKANTPYTVVCAANNLNVNVYVWKTADIKNNVAVNLYEATHDATQQFVFTKKDGAYLMQPYKATGYTVNINTAKAKAGSKLITYKKAAANDEYWIIEKKGAGYTFRMKSAPSLYMTASGKTLQLAKYSGSNNQIFKIAPVNTTPATAKKILNVPYIKQNDPRWANQKIAKIKGTEMKNIGCALTCITMVMSYKDGKSGNPYNPVEYAKAKKLITQPKYNKNNKITNSGSVGNTSWPGWSAWKAYKNNSKTDAAALAAIKKQIDKGNPVVVQGTRSKGYDHYIVVYGYDNGGTARKDFKIWDPQGTGKKLTPWHTTLDAFLKTFNTGYALKWYTK